MIVNDRLGVDADGVVDRREELRGVDRIFCGSRAGGVGFAMHITALDACATNDCGIAVRPVITSIGAVVVTGGGDTFFRTTSELAESDDERLFQKTAGIEVVEQGGEALI